MTSPWVDGEPLNAATMFARTTLLISQLQNQGRQVQRTTTLNVPDGTATAVTSWSVGSTYNVGGISYGAGIFTPSVPGLYRWTLTVLWPATTTTHSRQQFVFLNGSTTTANEGRNAWSYYGAQSTNLTLTAGGELVMAAGDTLQAVIAHNAGSTLAVTPTAFTLARAA